jgi:hypothetical protein
MILAPKQVKEFWRLWPQACSANGWTRENGMTAAAIDAKRKEVLRECGFNSLTEVDRRDGFTKVKNKLLVLIGVSVQAGVEANDPVAHNNARIHRHVIETEILPCLALYVEDVTGYVATVIAGLTRHYKTDRPTRPPTLSDLDIYPAIAQRRTTNPTCCAPDGRRVVPGPSQLEQCLMTLSARLNALRKAAGDSIHDMKTKAGLECNCAQCCRRRGMCISSASNEEAKMNMLTADPDWTV